MLDLFADAEPWQEPLAPGAVILQPVCTLPGLGAAGRDP